MENLQIGIEGDNGQIIGYNIDSELIEGLYITIDIDKIKENCVIFEVEMGSWADNNETTKMSKRDKLVILTIKTQAEKAIQFLVGGDMNLKQMKLISSKVLPSEIKKMIKDCHALAHKSTLSDLLKK